MRWLWPRQFSADPPFGVCCSREAMLKAAAERGWIDLERAVDETLTAMARAATSGGRSSVSIISFCNPSPASGRVDHT